MGPMGNRDTGGMGHMGNGAQGNGYRDIGILGHMYPLTLWASLPMCPIPPVSPLPIGPIVYTPCIPYPCTPIAHVGHCPMETE